MGSVAVEKKVLLSLQPFKPEDPVAFLRVLTPRDKGLDILNGILDVEPEDWLLSVLKQLEGMNAGGSESKEMFSAYYYSLSFAQPGFVKITGEYVPEWGVKLSYANLAKIVHAILDYRTKPRIIMIELTLSDEEGPYALASPSG